MGLSREEYGEEVVSLHAVPASAGSIPVDASARLPTLQRR
jgi:hypothetical protein